MATTKGATNGSQRHIQIIVRRRGAGIILAIFTILFLMGTGVARRAQAQTYIVLHNFTGGTNDGASPQGDLVRDSAGNLYGTTSTGGSDNVGTVFKLAPSGTLTVLHSFSGGSDGETPQAALVMDSAGNLYGTASYGGSPTCPGGCGTVFELNTSGSGFTVLHSFAGYDNNDPSASDGGNPKGDLVRDSAGNLYGTTSTGGSNDYGTVFKLAPSGTLTVLHSFSGGSDGETPQAGLLMGPSHTLYGTTYNGGSNDDGTVFELNTSGGGFTVLHNFTGGTNDGSNPTGDLVRDSHGNLYGTTQGGGSDYGTVFKLDPSGALTLLHSFAGYDNNDPSASDGETPQAGLVMDSAGNLYGTTNFGGTLTSPECETSDETCGTVFELDLSGTLTLLHSFDYSDGTDPEAGLVMDSAGNLYGTTYMGGSDNVGTVFVLSATPQGAIQFIITQVNSLLAQGVINQGQDNSLVKELQDAIGTINAGKINGAIGNLESFIGEVDDLENSGVLTGAQASALTSPATTVIQQLQAM